MKYFWSKRNSHERRVTRNFQKEVKKNKTKEKKAKRKKTKKTKTERRRKGNQASEQS